jgi:hypothetical protein
MVIEAMRSFLDDGTLDFGDLKRIMDIALEDCQIDENERRNR